MLRRPRIPLLIALGGLAALVVVHLVAFGTGAGRRADARVLEGFFGLDRPRVRPLADAVANLASPKPFTVFALALVAVALVRRRPRTALAAAGVLLAANLTTQLLKPALATPRFAHLDAAHHIDAASWPSGHATASMTLVLAAILVSAPRWRRWVAAAGAAFTVAVCFAFLSLAWHFPSDVLGGYLVAATWMALAVAGLAASAGRGPAAVAARTNVTVREALAPVGALALAALVLAAFGVIARPHAALAYMRAHTFFVLGAMVIGALGLSLAAGLALALRRPSANAAA